jgi:hypothetical protein
VEGGELIMQVALTLKHMYPGAKFDVVEYANGELVIEKWEHSEPQPSMEAIQAHWNINEAVIMEKPKTEFELLKEAVDELILQGSGF